MHPASIGIHGAQTPLSGGRGLQQQQQQQQQLPSALGSTSGSLSVGSVGSSVGSSLASELSGVTLALIGPSVIPVLVGSMYKSCQAGTVSVCDQGVQVLLPGNQTSALGQQLNTQVGNSC